MNQITSCGGKTVVTNSKGVTVDGVLTKYKKGMSGKSMTMINGNVFIDGHELRDGKWKRTFWALWHLLF